jgi:hypothetical protein
MKLTPSLLINKNFSANKKNILPRKRIIIALLLITFLILPLYTVCSCTYQGQMTNKKIDAWIDILIHFDIFS